MPKRKNDNKANLITKILIAVITVAGTVLVGYWQFVYKPDESIEKFTYVGRVKDAETGAPIKGAKITLDIKGIPPVVYTDSEGIYKCSIYYSGEKLEGRIHVKKEGYIEYDRLITLGTDLEIEDIRMGPRLDYDSGDFTPDASIKNIPEIRVKYYVFEGYTLLKNILSGDESLGRLGFDKAPYWLKNEVFRELEDLDKSYLSEPASRSPFHYISLKIFNKEKGLVKSILYRPFLGGEPPDEVPFFYRKPDCLDIDIFEEANIRRYIEKVKKDPYYTLIGHGILGLPRFSEVYEEVEEPLSKELLRRNPELRDIVFVIFPLHEEEPECGAGRVSYAAEIYVRELKLMVLGIENIGETNLSIEKIHQRIFKPHEDDYFRLRTDSENRKFLETSEASTPKPPFEKLTKGEHLLIPLQISMGITEEEGSFDDLYILKRWLNEDLLREKLQRNSSIELKYVAKPGYYDDMRRYHAYHKEKYLIDSNVLLDKPRLSSLVENNYILGTSIRIESIEYSNKYVDQIDEKVREFDQTNLVMRGGWEIGSCPYVFTYDKEAERWVRDTTIIYGFDSKEKEGVQERALKNFDGQIWIKELEPETSYVDYVVIKLKDKNGNECYIEPKNDILKEMDNSYLVLKRDDKVLVEFEDYPDDFEEASIIAKGYYIPSGSR